MRLEIRTIIDYDETTLNIDVISVTTDGKELEIENYAQKGNEDITFDVSPVITVTDPNQEIPELSQEDLAKINAKFDDRMTEQAIQIKSKRDKEAKAFEDR